MDWMLMPLRRYADFAGRSRRKEYWMFILFCIIVAIPIFMIESALDLPKFVAGVYGPLLLAFGLALAIPSLAVAVRRFHDQDKSGWFVLIGYIWTPLSWIAMAFGSVALLGIVTTLGAIGGLIMIVFMLLEGTRGPNRFGPDPKGGDAAPMMDGPQQI
jgi:uncharacterized membrane protein YhaH (DUF805 family)